MKNTKLFYGSSYDRALEHLLNMWADIKSAVPEATLDACYGWDLFDKAYGNNAERQAWKDKINKLMSQEGITHHGRVSQKKLREIRKTCGIWAYPTHFTEINCITALECQNDGLVPVVINLAALKETVGSGVRVEGDIYMPETKEEYKRELISLMQDTDRWEKESKKAQKFAKDYDWKIISAQWLKHF